MRLAEVAREQPRDYGDDVAALILFAAYSDVHSHKKHQDVAPGPNSGLQREGPELNLARSTAGGHARLRSHAMLACWPQETYR